MMTYKIAIIPQNNKQNYHLKDLDCVVAKTLVFPDKDGDRSPCINDIGRGFHYLFTCDHDSRAQYLHSYTNMYL